MSSKVLLLGNDMLRNVSRKIRHVDSSDVQRVASELHETLAAKPGWGLSAIQLGYPLKMFMMASPKLGGRAQIPFFKDKILTKEYNRHVHYSVVINPTIVNQSVELDTDYEGCLSAPGVAALVPRHTWIEAEFLTLDNTVFRTRLSGHPARLFQHEYDHLEGIMFLDRVLDTCDIFMDAELERQQVERGEPPALDDVFALYH